MIHLIFLIGNLLAVHLTHKLLLTLLSQREQWQTQRRFHLIALALPSLAIILFSLAMLPEMLTSSRNNSMQQTWEQQLLLLGIFLPLLLIIIALALNILRLMGLYLSTYRRSWQAPPHFATGQTGLYPANFVVRFSYHPRPFAYTLPALWPGTPALVILSTALVERLDQEEMQAVLWHEAGHLWRGDFWLTWLATWWHDAFFYLPASQSFLQSLRAAQERSCDAWVATARGQQTALALASALLKVWEYLVQTAGKGFTLDPQAPGLASDNNPILTEQRVTCLLEQVNQPDHQTLRPLGFTRWGTEFTLAGSVLLWLLLVGSLHLFLLPFGCILFLHLF